MAPDRVCTIIVACIILHNIAIHLREPEVDDGVVGEEEYDLHEECRGPCLLYTSPSPRDA